MRYFKLVLIYCLLASFAFAALPTGNTMVWEVRPTAGSDSNGGGFVTGAGGTDFSQQNSAQYTFGTLATTNGSTACGITDANHGFGPTDVGNIMQINSGTNWTPGFYEIISTFAGSATLDRPCASTATASSGTYHVGGAFATISQGNIVDTAGNIIWVKASGTLSVSTALQVTGVHTSLPTQFLGYTSTRGDNGRVTWTMTANSTDIIIAEGSQGYTFKNFNFTTSAGTVAAGVEASASNGNVPSGTWWFDNCKWTGFTDAVLGFWNSNQSFSNITISNSEITTSTSHAVYNTGATVLLGDYIHDNTGDGFRYAAGASNARGPTIAAYSIFYNNGGNGLTNPIGTLASGNNQDPFIWFILINNDISNNTGDGVNVTGGAQSIQAWNNIITSNGGYGINFTSSNAAQMNAVLNNAFYSNTSGSYVNVFTVGDVILTGVPYTSAGSNFTLNSTSGAGAACKNAGFPGVLNAGGTGYTDIGALRHQDPSGGGGAVGFPIVQ